MYCCNDNSSVTLSWYKSGFNLVFREIEYLFYSDIDITLTRKKKEREREREKERERDYSMADRYRFNDCMSNTMNIPRQYYCNCPTYPVKKHS